jgi:hypothetical protein
MPPGVLPGPHQTLLSIAEAALRMRTSEEPEHRDIGDAMTHLLDQDNDNKRVPNKEPRP